ncbi:MAG TPA: hypothetical protein VNW94_23030, partial [Streptosporangiaceae bacterium]|nr:hypothetical protein [Streptosporangiaceae bacterium]
GDTPAIDHVIAAAMKADGNYHVVTVVRTRDVLGPGAYTIWEYAPSRPKVTTVRPPARHPRKSAKKAKLPKAVKK